MCIFIAFQLKDRVGPRLQVDYMKSDFYLIRWIRLSNLNVDQAEKLLIEVKIVE